MNHRLYLGCCQYDTPHGRTFTRFSVLAYAEAGAWRFGDFMQALPPEGCAFAPNLPAVRKGDYLAFHVVQNDRLETGKDEWLVEESFAVAEVVDFRDQDLETARWKLVEDGVKRLLPGTKHIVVALPEGVCVVVPMVQQPAGGTFIAGGSDLQALQTFKFDHRLFEGDKVRGSWLSVPELTAGRPVGTVDWRSDGVLVLGAPEA